MKKFQYIIFIDVAGYTQAMNEDQSMTKKKMEIYDELIEGSLKKINGRIISKSGDGYYILSPQDHSPITVIDAMNGILEKIGQLKDFLSIRIGIHYAAIDEEEGRDPALNLAARLESSSNPNSISISENLYDNIKSSTNLEFKLLEKELKGFGKVKFYNYQSNISKNDYNLPTIEQTEKHETYFQTPNYKVRVKVIGKEVFLETEYNDGTKLYAEIDENGNVQPVLDPNIKYTLVLPPDADILKKEELIDGAKRIVKIKYKWNGKIELRYDSQNKLKGFSSKNFLATISNEDKTIRIDYNFEHKIPNIVSKGTEK